MNTVPYYREFQVIYKGDRDCPADYDNFTLNKQYTAREATKNEVKDDDFEAYITLTNDLGKRVTVLSIDFDFLS